MDTSPNIQMLQITYLKFDKLANGPPKLKLTPLNFDIGAKIPSNLSECTFKPP